MRVRSSEHENIGEIILNGCRAAAIADDVMQAVPLSVWLY